MENNDQGTEQPTGLFSYIAGQQLVAASNDEAVNLQSDDAPGEGVSAGSSQNAPEAGASEEQQGVTTQPFVPDQATLLRLQQENETLRQSQQKERELLMLLGQQSGQREKDLFERSIAHLDEDDQAAEREKRRVASLEAQNQWYEQTLQSQSQREYQVQEHMDKTRLAHMIVERLQLPNDPELFGVLMESQSPAEMAYQAKRLHGVNARVAAATQQQFAATAAQSGVHVADGTSVPSKPANKVATRSNDLIGMMQERAYELGNAM